MKKIYTWGSHPKYKMYESVAGSKAKTELAETRAFNKEEKYLGQHDFNIDTLNNWKPPKLITVKEDKRKKYLDGDMNTWIGKSHIISQNMIDKIGDTLEKYGVFLPLEVVDREEKLYRYWVTNEIPLSYIDKEKSRFFDNDCKEDYAFLIERLILKEECLDVPMIFRVKEEYMKNVFVTEEFIELIKKHNLTGFKFSKDTSYECAEHENCHILVG